MKVTIYGIKNCNTMKKTFDWYAEKGIEYQFVDYTKVGIVKDQLSKWIAAVGWDVLLNRKGLTWKKLCAPDHIGVNQQKAEDLMVASPTVIKRPVVCIGGQVIVGFSHTAWSEALSGGRK